MKGGPVFAIEAPVPAVLRGLFLRPRWPRSWLSGRDSASDPTCSPPAWGFPGPPSTASCAATASPASLDLDRTTREVIRYQKDRPGELLHLDTKKLARIPDGGGHRMLGRSPGTKRRGAGYEYLHVAVDDCTRAAYVEVLPDERGETAAGFLRRACRHFADHGVRVQAILTDRAFCYTNSTRFRKTCASRGIRHQTTRPYRPQTNGKAERFIRTLLHEWAYAELYRSNEDRRRQLPRWLMYYNHQRPHTALGGSSPMPFLVNKVCGHYS